MERLAAVVVCHVIERFSENIELYARRYTLVCIMEKYPFVPAL